MVDGPYLTGKLVIRDEAYYKSLPEYNKIHFGSSDIILDIGTGEWTISPELNISEASKKIYEAIRLCWNTGG